MADAEKGGLTIVNSYQFNATLWAARETGLNQFADELIKGGRWEDVDGRRTRMADLNPEQASIAIRLASGVVSGRIAVHESYKHGASQILFERLDV